MFFLLLLCLFGTTADYCNVCAWPHVGTLNQRSQCVIGVGYQPNLDATCANWCLLQNESSMAIPSVLIAPSKSTTGYQCVCDWRDENNNLQYVTRPANSCPSSVLGPSDDVIDSWKDYAANSSSSARPVIGNYDIPSISQMPDYQTTYNQVASNPRIGHVNMVNSFTGNIEMSPDPALFNILQGMNSISDFQTSMAKYIHRSLDSTIKTGQNRSDSASSRIADSLATVLSVARNSATGDQLSAAENDLMYAINSRAGGSGSGISSTDLSNAFGRVASSLDSLRSAMSSDSGSPNGTDLSGVMSGIRSVKTSVDSGAQSVVRDAMDREHRALYSDSAAHLAYMDYLDSVYSAGSGGGSGVSASEGIGFLTDSSSRAGSALSAFLAAVNNITNVNSSCSDGHIPYDNVDVTLWGKYELKVDFAQFWSNSVFQGVLSFMRLMASLTGAISGLLSALSVFAWLSSRTGVSRFEGGSISG